jgi:hypothetical protein
MDTFRSLLKTLTARWCVRGYEKKALTKDASTVLVVDEKMMKITTNLGKQSRILVFLFEQAPGASPHPHHV